MLIVSLHLLMSAKSFWKIGFILGTEAYFIISWRKLKLQNTSAITRRMTGMYYFTVVTLTSKSDRRVMFSFFENMKIQQKSSRKQNKSLRKRPWEFRNLKKRKLSSSNRLKSWNKYWMMKIPRNSQVLIGRKVLNHHTI